MVQVPLMGRADRVRPGCNGVDDTGRRTGPRCDEAANTAGKRISQARSAHDCAKKAL
jgi:hypothetical protein